MEKTSISSLEFTHIGKSVAAALEYIEGRKSGKIVSMKTGFSKLDKTLLNGIEWDRIFTIAAMSGSGKSVLCEQLKRNMLKLNPKEDFDILSFEFEMPAKEQVLRNLSGRIRQPVNKILSGDEPLDDETFEKIKENAKYLSMYPIWSVENTGSVEEVLKTVLDFIEYRKIKSRNAGIVITIDHVLLTLGKQGEDERKIVATLYRKIVQLKKYLIKQGIPVIFILLSQLNRGIETPERKMNTELHYPNRTDIFGSSDIFMCSDYVLVIHKPAILNLTSYGMPKPGFSAGLPVYSPKDPKQAMIYFHLLKQRSGEPKIMSMLDNFKNSKIDEYES